MKISTLNGTLLGDNAIHIEMKLCKYTVIAQYHMCYCIMDQLKYLNAFQGQSHADLIAVVQSGSDCGTSNLSNASQSRSGSTSVQAVFV